MTTFFVPPPAVLPVTFYLNLNEALLSAAEKLATAPASANTGSSL